MTLGDRVQNIRKIVDGSKTDLSARDICNLYLTEVTTSDVLTTGTILNTMTELGLLKKTATYKGKSPRYRYEKK
jgi:Fe2+ or Zn2+ uptake regulation protein